MYLMYICICIHNTYTHICGINFLSQTNPWNLRCRTPKVRSHYSLSLLPDLSWWVERYQPTKNPPMGQMKRWNIPWLVGEVYNQKQWDDFSWPTFLGMKKQSPQHWLFVFFWGGSPNNSSPWGSDGLKLSKQNSPQDPPEASKHDAIGSPGRA